MKSTIVCTQKAAQISCDDSAPEGSKNYHGHQCLKPVRSCIFQRVLTDQKLIKNFLTANNRAISLEQRAKQASINIKALVQELARSK